MADINQKLDILYGLLVDNIDTLKSELINIIPQPDKITDTNKFATLLTQLKEPDFISPLLLQISLGNKGDNWLSNYLYAAIILLSQSSFDDEFSSPANLVSKLESWMIGNTGELSWKAADLLKYMESNDAERIQLKKLEERGDFFLTYAECILGLLRYNEARYIPLVEQIAADETRDDKLREFCRDIINDKQKTL